MPPHTKAASEKSRERTSGSAVIPGMNTLDVVITDAPLSDSQLAVVRLSSFFHRRDLTPPEKASACKQLLDLNPGWKAQDLAALLHVDPSMITRLLSPSKCTPTVVEAFKAGVLPPPVAAQNGDNLAPPGAMESVKTHRWKLGNQAS